MAKFVGDFERFKALTEKLRKDWLLCLLKDTAIHLCEAQSFSSSLSKIDEEIDDLQATTENLAKKFDSTSNQSCSFASPAPVHVNAPKQDLNLKTDEHELQLKFVGMPENDIKFPNEKKSKEKKDVESILTKIDSSVEISECRRLGKDDTDKSRPILVTFKNVWDRRNCFSQALKSKLYHSDKTFVLPRYHPKTTSLKRSC